MRVLELSVTYSNGVCALKDASVTFERGSFNVVLGSSGAGKTTLLRCLNGLVTPSAGSVFDNEGVSIHGTGTKLRAHRRKTAMIFQQHHLIGRLSVLQNVLLGRLSFHSPLRSIFPKPRRDRVIALEALERVNLLDQALSRADEISGGQQQRVGVARALAQQPEIILADEPVASLDPETSVKVLVDLHRICREDGITAIVSLHQVDLARRFADRILGLAGGRIVADLPAGQFDDDRLEQIYRDVPRPLKAAAE